MVQRGAAELGDAVGPDGLLHLGPGQRPEVGVGGVEDLEVAVREVGEEGGALGRPLGFRDVEQPVGQGPFAGSVFGGGVGRWVGGWCCHFGTFFGVWEVWWSRGH